MITYKEKIKSYSKHMNISNLIKICLFFCGHYVVTNTTKPLIYVHKVFCIIFAVAVSQACFAKGKFSICMLIMEYIMSIVLSLMFGDEYLFRFCRAIKTNDIMMGIKKKSIFDDITRIAVFIFFAARILITSFELYVQSNFSYRFFCVCVVVLTHRMICLIVSIILYTCYVRMRLLRRRFEEITIPVNIINEAGAMCKVREVRRCLQHYHNLLDIMKDIDREFQCLLYIITLLCVPKFVIHFYRKIKVYGQPISSAMEWTIQILDIVDGFLITCTPAVIAELIKNEVEILTRALSKQLLRCSDESVRFELQKALHYITIRPFEYVLWGAVPLDVTFIVNFVALCITYIIVALQIVNFTDIL